MPLIKPKIPFTDHGIAIIESEIRAQLLEGVSAGYINDDFVITVPKAREVSANNRANRILPDIKFTATLQGALHKVTVAGVVSI